MGVEYKGEKPFSKEHCFKKRGIMKGNEGDYTPLPPRRIHPRYKWRGILWGSHNARCNENPLVKYIFSYTLIII